jgi:hypothetical protein
MSRLTGKHGLITGEPQASALKRPPVSEGRQLGEEAPIVASGASGMGGARAIVYFASDESACTVGGELVIDGGTSNL